MRVRDARGSFPCSLQALRALAAVLSLAGCASTPPARPAALDPANPGAPESPAPATFTSLGATPIDHPPSSAVRQTSPPPPKAAVLYTCPMHPEVISSTPGKCPKCGMKLVPAKAKAPPDGDRAQP
jgi:hypothetical protein